MKSNPARPEGSSKSKPTWLNTHQYSAASVFCFLVKGRHRLAAIKETAMIFSNSKMAQEIALAALTSQQKRAGHAPRSVSVVMAENTLVITLHGALSEAEKAVAKEPAGAAQVQEFHRQLFNNSSDWLRQEIKRITGVEVRESTAEIETSTGTVVQAFTTGTMVQVFLLASGLPTETWSGSAAGKPL
jgi:uncharacterized protein YbcI